MCCAFGNGKRSDNHDLVVFQIYPSPSFSRQRQGLPIFPIGPLGSTQHAGVKHTPQGAPSGGDTTNTSGNGSSARHVTKSPSEHETGSEKSGTSAQNSPASGVSLASGSSVPGSAVPGSGQTGSGPAFANASLSALQRLTNSPLSSVSSSLASSVSSVKSAASGVNPASSAGNSSANATGGNKLVRNMEQESVKIQEMVSKVVDKSLDEGESEVAANRPILRRVLQQIDQTMPKGKMAAPRRPIEIKPERDAQKNGKNSPGNQTEAVTKETQPPPKELKEVSSRSGEETASKRESIPRDTDNVAKDTVEKTRLPSGGCQVEKGEKSVAKETDNGQPSSEPGAKDREVKSTRAPYLGSGYQGEEGVARGVSRKHHSIDEFDEFSDTEEDEKEAPSGKSDSGAFTTPPPTPSKGK